MATVEDIFRKLTVLECSDRDLGFRTKMILFFLFTEQLVRPTSCECLGQTYH